MGNDLHVGDSDTRVAETRSTLIRLGFLNGNNADVPDQKKQQFVESDKLFTEELSHVLKAFQQSRGIFPSGVLDSATLREIRHASYTLGARELNYQPENELVGDDVVQLQSQLQELGFYAHRRDGHFGAHTFKAVQNFQVNSGLESDGACGPDTLRALGLLGRRIRGGSPQAIRERETVRAAGPQLSGKRVVIDPALGGSNTGLQVRGRYGSITEEELLWDLASRVEQRMNQAGMETIISRTRNDDPAPQARADMANGFNADLMISLHCDRYSNEKANGAATFYFGSEIGATSLTGEMLSSYIQREIVARTKLNNCGSHARTWQILRMTSMPTIEVVAGYLTNPGDVAILTNPAMRDRIAEAIVVAVKRLYLLDEDDQPTGTYEFAELLRAEGL